MSTVDSSDGAVGRENLPTAPAHETPCPAGGNACQQPAGPLTPARLVGLLRDGSFASHKNLFTLETVPLSSIFYKRYKGERWFFSFLTGTSPSPRGAAGQSSAGSTDSSSAEEPGTEANPDEKVPASPHSHNQRPVLQLEQRRHFYAATKLPFGTGGVVWKVLYILEHNLKPYHHDILVTFSRPPSERGNTTPTYRRGTSLQSRFSNCRGVSAPQNTLPICPMGLFWGGTGR